MSAGMENVAPVYGAAPPDQQEMTLEEHLDAVLAVVMKDGGIDPNEMRVLGAFFKAIDDFAKGAQGAGQDAQMQPNADPRAMNAQTEDYNMAGGGQDVSYQGGY